MPFGGGLAGEKWITQEFGRRIDYLETVDAVKYRKSGMAFSAAS